MNTARLEDQQGSRRHFLALATAACAFLLLFAGGLVNSTDSGLAVPDWPLSFGKLMPEMVGGVLFEHGHRMIAGAVALLVFALGGWTLLEEERGWVRATARFAMGLIVVQAVLGGVTVVYGLPPAVSVAHAVLGQTVFCLLVAIAEGTSPVPEQKVPGDIRGIRRLGFITTGAVFIQLILGAVLRHTGGGLAPHAFWAFVTATITLTMGGTVLSQASGTRLSRPAAVLSVLVLIQLFLGAASASTQSGARLVGTPRDVLFTSAHLACGALVLATSWLITLRALRMEKR